MFSEPDRISGLIPAGATLSDPANDPELLSETENHYWFQFNTGSGMQDADPLIAGATVGQSFTTASTTFAEVPDNLRETTEIQLVAEITNTASSLFGQSGQTDTTVLDQTFNDVDLVGRPLSIGNFVSTNSVSALIASTTTNTYSPFIAQNDDAYPSTQSDLIRGTSYQEVLTTLPFGSQVLTGLFLTIIQSGPQGPTQSYERTLYDAIGYAARQNGGSSSTSINPANGPSVSPLSVWTVNVQPGPVAIQAAGTVINELTQVQQQLTADQAAGNVDPGEESLDQRDVMLTTELNADDFFFASNISLLGLEQAGLITAYYARPRVVISSGVLTTPAGSTTPMLTFAIDLRSDAILAIAYPGQSTAAIVAFNLDYGISENVTEANILTLNTAPGSTQPTPVNSASILQQAQSQGIAVVTITQANLSELGSLAISADAKAQITTEVDVGQFVIVPSQSVLVNGAATVAWYEIDPTTGQTIGVTQDGGNQGLVEYAAVVGFTAVATGFAFYNIEKLDIGSYSSPAAFKQQLKKDALVIGTAGAVIALSGAGFAFVAVELPVLLIGSAIVLGFGGGLSLGSLATLLDPPLPDFLVSPPPDPALTGLSSPGSLAVAVAPDSLFTLPAGGAELPTVFRVGINNEGTTEDKYNLSVTNVPAGFTAMTSVSQIDVQPGATAEVGLVLEPSGTLPAPGTNVSFDVTATSATTTSNTASATESFTVPSIDAVTVTGSTTSLNATPGTPVADTLTITNTGNVTESNVTLTSALSSGLVLNGLSPVSLQPGQSTTETVTLTPAASTPLNSQLVATVTATFGPSGSPLTQTLTIPVTVEVPGASAIADASVTAAQFGNTALAD